MIRMLREPFLFLQAMMIALKVMGNPDISWSTVFMPAAIYFTMVISWALINEIRLNLKGRKTIPLKWGAEEMNVGRQRTRVGVGIEGHILTNRVRDGFKFEATVYLKKDQNENDEPPNAATHDFKKIIADGRVYPSQTEAEDAMFEAVNAFTKMLPGSSPMTRSSSKIEHIF